MTSQRIMRKSSKGDWLLPSKVCTATKAQNNSQISRGVSQQYLMTDAVDGDCAEELLVPVDTWRISGTSELCTAKGAAAAAAAAPARLLLLVSICLS